MRFVDLKIRNKLAIVMILFAMAIIAVLTALYYFQFQEALKERVFLQLSSVRQLKISQIEHRLETIVEDFTHFNDSTRFKEIEGHIFHDIVKNDTMIGPFSIELRSDFHRVYIEDLTTSDSLGRITLALLQHVGDEIEVALIQPDLQSILLERTGLGETGESYLVGEDFKLRSSSRFYPHKPPTEITAKTDGVDRALSGETFHGLIQDYRGVPVFSAFDNLKFYNLSWVILSEIDEQEALFPLKSLRNNLALVLALLILIILFVSYELSRQLVKPVILAEKYLQTMARGVFKPLFVSSRRADEIGQMFFALEKLIEALDQTVKFADAVGSGDFEMDYKLLSHEDKLGEALLEMRDKLRAYQENEKQLKLQNQRSLISGEEKERQRFSRELHDGLGPMLTILRIKVESSEISAEIKKELLRLFDDTLGEMRKISNNLMPSVLTDFGAGEAIRNLLKQVDGSISVNYQYDKDESVTIPLQISIAVYRVVQEALNNVLKHAHATRINISFTEFEDRVSLFIQDDGAGFDLTKHSAGNGLSNMRERVNVENGIFEIQSEPAGTTIEVEIPIP